MIAGLDILALAKMNATMIAHEMAPKSAVGFLVGTFGDYKNNLITLCKSGKVVAIRAHLSNGPCQRNGNCELGEPTPTDFEALEKRAARLMLIMRDFPRIKVYISPRLEHDETNRAIVTRWITGIRDAAPTAIPVISAFKGYVPPDVLVEKHGNKVRADVISNDGESLFTAPPNWHRNANQLALGWIPECNGKSALQQPWVPPTQRHVQLTADHIRRMQVKLGVI